MEKFSMFTLVSFKLFVAAFFFSVVFWSSFGMPWSNKKKLEKEKKNKEIETKPEGEE